jgi:DNA-directed RNA polymerase subunit RPC12/RpoP
MPINPGETENEQEFISRCMGIETGDYEQDQAYAICKSKWDNKDMSSQSRRIVCDECGWSWDLEDGGDDPYLCHKCGRRVSEEAQQGGVVAGTFGRTKFTYPVKSKEALNDYMARCMSDSSVREKKPDRGNRAGFCYTSYQDFYIMSIGKRWK